LGFGLAGLTHLRLCRQFDLVLVELIGGPTDRNVQASIRNFGLVFANDVQGDFDSVFFANVRQGRDFGASFISPAD
jgi:hypothetical protein